MAVESAGISLTAQRCNIIWDRRSEDYRLTTHPTTSVRRMAATACFKLLNKLCTTTACIMSSEWKVNDWLLTGYNPSITGISQT